MKKRVKNTFMGLVLIGLAVLIIANQVGISLFPRGISGARLVYGVICAVVFVNGLFERNLWTIGFSVGFGYWILQEPCRWPHLSIWVLLLTVVLVCSGLELIFRKKRIHIRVDKEAFEEAQKEGAFNKGESYYNGGDMWMKDAVFSNVTRYVQDMDFAGGKMDVAFSNVRIYFDQAKLHNGQAVVSFDSAFSSVTVYVPKEWNVIDNTSRVFSCRRGSGDIRGTEEQTLIVEGDCVFGNLQIQRV
ncbi:hypothetical protein SAMN02910358_01528 [Lachnospiraceae bacterium XBB1006]|nr:hypothetical protein SAMN02910358_01528 [Lachnospiraceae bacterium XBB1006]